MNELNTDLLAILEGDIFGDAPIASTLRKAIVLGGRAGSSELRDWASRELEGYTDDADVPGYRRLVAAIKIDVQVGNQWRTGQTISPSIIPEFARELFAAGPILYDGIGAIEAMAEEVRGKGSSHMTHARAMDVCASMDKASGNPFQQTTALYWDVSYASIAGLVDQVRTRLSQLVAEMRVHTPLGQVLPTPEVAADAVQRIIQQSERRSKA